MKSLQFLALCACALLGSLAGSWIALTPKVEAQAQVRSGAAQVTVNETLIVPDGGLRIVDMRQRPLGYFGVTQNGLSLVLFGRNGSPSVTLEGGSGGQVIVGASSTTAGISMASQNGNTANLVATQQGARMELIKQNRAIKLNLGDDTTFSLSGRTNQPLFSINSLPEGGQIRLFNAAGKEAMEISSSNESGKVKLSGPQGGTKLEADGRGQITILKGSDLLWSAIKQGAKEEPNPTDTPPNK